MDIMTGTKYSRPVYGTHPFGGNKAMIMFQDRYKRPCIEENAERAVYIEYDIKGIPVHVKVLFGEE